MTTTLTATTTSNTTKTTTTKWDSMSDIRGRVTVENLILLRS